MPFLNHFREDVNCECGLVTFLEGLHISHPVPVPLNRVHVTAKVVDFVAQVTVEQHYVNQEKQPIEAVYKFPVEEEAAVVEFQAEIDGRIVKTIVKGG